MYIIAFVTCVLYMSENGITYLVFMFLPCIIPQHINYIHNGGEVTDVIIQHALFISWNMCWLHKTSAFPLKGK